MHLLKPLKVTNYAASSVTTSSYYLSADVGAFPIKGKPLYPVYSYKWAGLDPLTGDPQGYDTTGQISKNYSVLNAVKEEDLEYHGSAILVYYGDDGD